MSCSPRRRAARAPPATASRSASGALSPSGPHAQDRVLLGICDLLAGRLVVTRRHPAMSGHSKWSSIKHQQALTDNRNRTVADVRSIITKHGGNLAAAGAVAWMFHKRGLITVERAGVDEDRVMEVALEGGAEDVREAGDLLEIITAPEQFDKVKEALDRAKVPLGSAEVTMLPQSTVAISGKQAEQMVRLLEALEDHDDVQSVSSNMDIAAEELERLSA